MYAEIIVDVLNSEVDKVFDYLCSPNIIVPLGAKVLVPFGNRKIEGYVLNVKETTSLEETKIKSIIRVFDDIPLIKPELISLCYKMKQIFHLRLIDGIRCVLPSQVREGKVGHIEKRMLSLNDEVLLSYLPKIKANAKNEQGVIEYLKNFGNGDFTTLSKKFTSSTLNKLIKIGVINEIKQIQNRKVVDGAKQINNIKLTQTQQKAVDTILNDKNKRFLLHGVTGSGKTEVYLNVIENVLNQGKTAIMLVPEISLTPQVIRIFSSRFGQNIAVLHSGLSAGEKHDEWCRIYSGEARVVVGARSAIFAPLENLGVIIIDEEHDNSYVSDSNPRYNTYDVAKMRNEFNNCPLVLGSATPSIETYHLTNTGELTLIEMPVRVNGKEMPPIEIVDMCNEFRSGNTSPFSKKLVEDLTETVTGKKQAILFINRRGFSSFIMCRDCGYIPKCENCDFSLVYHKEDGQLKCHYCGKRYRAINVCPNCMSKNLKMGGIGTQQVVHQLKELFPDVAVFRMDNDTTQNKNAHAKILGEFGNTKPSILVGTQMVAKGHDFPAVNLVGILDADLSLYFSDFRASEKTFQLITQVAGRAGRSDIEGKVVLQTYYPKHYVYKLCSNYDYNKFYAKEVNLREATQYPPFGKIIRLLFTSESDDHAKNITHEAFINLKNLRMEFKSDFYFLEAMKSPVTKIKNKYRYQILMRFSIEKSEEIISKIYEYLNTLKLKDTTCFVEINPLSMS